MALMFVLRDAQATPIRIDGVMPDAPELSAPPFKALTNRCLPASLLMTRHLRDAGFQAKVLTFRVTDISKKPVGHALCVFAYAGKTWAWDSDMGSVVIGDANLINNVSIFVVYAYLVAVNIPSLTIIDSEFILPSALDKCR
jgi:hypothetical protein